MQNEDEKGGYEAKFEALLSRAVNENFERELNEFTEDELAAMYTMPEGHEQRMEKLFATGRRKTRVRSIAALAKRAAVIVVAIFGLALLHKDVRAGLYRIVVDAYDEFVSIAFTESKVETTLEWRPTYLPEGFAETSFTKNDAFTSIQYMRDDGAEIRLTYTRAHEGLCIFVDNENRTQSAILVNGHEGLLFTAKSEKHRNGIIWEQDGYVLKIWSSLDLSELQKIAGAVSAK